MNTANHETVTEAKARILQQVKSGALTVEQGMTALHRLKRRSLSETAKPESVKTETSTPASAVSHHQSDSLCTFLPCWQHSDTPAQPAVATRAILFGNDIPATQQLLNSEPQLDYAFVLDAGVDQAVVDHTGVHPSQAHTESCWQALAPAGAVTDSLPDTDSLFMHCAALDPLPEHALLLWQADTAESVPRLCEQLLQWLQGLLTGTQAEHFNTLVVSAFGAYSGVATQAFSGLVRSFRVEQPDFYLSVLHTTATETPRQIVQSMLQETVLPACDVDVRYVQGQRQVLMLVSQASMSETSNSGTSVSKTSVLKISVSKTSVSKTSVSKTKAEKHSTDIIRDKKHIVITGGNGGIARQLVRRLLDESRSCITLLGRSAPAAAVETFCQHHPDRLGYERADITQPHNLADAMAKAEQRFGAADLIIHAAGSLADVPFTRATLAQLHTVFQPKYQGLETLIDHYHGRNTPEFLVFSSIAAYLPHLGQSLYACANRAMVALAEERLPDAKRWTVHWPLWEEGGMQISDSDRELMRSEIGMLPLPTAVAWKGMCQPGYRDSVFCFGDRQIMSDFLQRAQCAVLKREPCNYEPYNYEPYNHETDKNQYLQKETSLNEPEEKQSATETEINDAPTPDVTETVLTLLSDATGYPKEKTSLSSRLEAMGLESMIITRLNVQFEKQFGRLPKTLLFDCQTVGDVVKQIQARLPASSVRHQTKKTATQSVSKSDVTVSKSGVTVPGSGVSTAEKNAARADSQCDDIAIIGMSGRYPQADNIEQFWQALQSGYDAVCPIPPERWSLDGFYQAEKTPGYSYGKWGSFINDADGFDPLFFAISPREAAAMDPQERLFLQQVWHLLEDAGYSLERLHRHSRDSHRGSNHCGSNHRTEKNKHAGQNNSIDKNGRTHPEHRVGVYVGVTSGQYQQLSAQDWGRGSKTLASSAYWSIANRVSYFLNLHGPSVALDTACSSSLSAVLMACDALRAGRITHAIAGGTNLNLDPSRYVALAEMNFLSSDGRCRSFGAGGDGYVPGEGIGALLLKPLRQAQKDGDRIDAVIRGGAINHGGYSNGYTVPSPAAQAALVKRALSDAGVSATDISYIETHGTGTELGDAVEIDGLRQAYEEASPGYSYKEASPDLSNKETSPDVLSKETSPGQPYPDNTYTQRCRLGSVKSNIGHLEAAAGIVGLTKLALQLRHQLLVPSLHSQPPNPNLDLEQSPFSVQTQCEPWSIEAGRERIAGLSSFGAGGSNAHVIVSQAPPSTITDRASNKHYHPTVPVAVFSAFNRERLQQLCESHSHWIKDQRDTAEFARYLYSLQVGRSALPARLALVADSWEALRNQLESVLQHGLETSAQFNRLFDHQVNQPVDLLADQSVEKNSHNGSPDFHALAQQWLNGDAIDWQAFWPATPPAMLDLPLYPFARQSHWYKARSPVAESITVPTVSVCSTDEQKTVLSPLLIRYDELSDKHDGSRVSEGFKNGLNKHTYRYNCMLDRHSPALQQHQVHGNAILSGMGQLALVVTMAKAAGLMPPQQAQGFEFAQVYWLQPLRGNDGDLHCQLQLVANGSDIEFTLSNAQGQLCSRGRLALTLTDDACKNPRDQTFYQPEFQSESEPAAALTMTGQQLYRQMAEQHYCYGAYYQGVERLTVTAGQAHYGLHPCPPENHCLHPGQLDAALHGIFAMEAAAQGSSALPYRVEKICVHQPVAQMVTGSIRRNDDNLPGEKSYAVQTADRDGNLCVTFSGFVAREINTAAACYLPVWVERSPLEPTTADQSSAEQTSAQQAGTGVAANALFSEKNHCLFYAAEQQVMADWLQASLTRAQVRCQLITVTESLDVAAYKAFIAAQDTIWFLPGIYTRKYHLADDAFVASRLADTLESLLALSKALLAERNRQRSLVILSNNSCSATGDSFNPLSAGLVGFAKTLAAEASHLRIFSLDLPLSAVTQPQSLPALEQLFAPVTPLPLFPAAYRDGKHYVEKYILEKNRVEKNRVEKNRVEKTVVEKNGVEKTVAEKNASVSKATGFRQQGVYLIIGGASGLGLMTARYLQKNYQARVILAGRKPLNGIDAQVREAFEYHAIDLSDRETLQTFIIDLRRRYGVLNGVIHSALVLHDSSIANLSVEALHTVMTAKVSGSINLLEALLPVAPDFILFYSSSIAQTCTPGQANYAAASCLQDALARYYSRYQQTIKIMNWGYWHKTGVVANEKYRALLAKKGALGIENEEGLQAVEHLLQSDRCQHVFLKLNQTGLRLWQPYTVSPSMTTSFTTPVLNTESNTESNTKNSTVHHTESNTEKSRLPVRWDLPYLQQFWADHQPPDNSATGELLNTYCQQQLLRVLQQQGLFTDRNQVLTLHGMAEQLSLTTAPEMNALLEAILHVLSEAGLLISHKNGAAAGWCLGQAVTTTVTARQVLQADANAQGYLTLLDHCLSALMDYLQGRISDTEVLFPGGSSALVEATYRGNRVTDGCNRMVAELVRDRVSHLLAAGRTQVNIIEIGAGTGSTTKTVLPLLQDCQEQVRYFFTDISSHFVVKARQNFADYPCLTSMLMDISSAQLDAVIAQQQLPACDILLASNVLHATPDIARTLKNCGKILGGDGAIIINEVTRNLDFVTLTFGLTRGWWLSQDTEQRMPHSPLLSPQLWQQQLLATGFEPLAFFGNSPQQAFLGQSVIAAEYRANTQTTVATAKAATPAVKTGAVNTHTVNTNTTDLSATLSVLKDCFSQVLGMTADELEPELPFNGLGLDSIIFPQLLTVLQQHYPALELDTLIAANTLQVLAEQLHPSAGNSGLPLARAQRVTEQQTISQQTISQQTTVQQTVSQQTTAQQKNTQTTGQLETIRASFSAVLGMAAEDLEADLPFHAMGLDSIVFPQLLAALQQDYPQLQLDALMAANTITGLLALFEQEVLEQEVFESEAPVSKKQDIKNQISNTVTDNPVFDKTVSQHVSVPHSDTPAALHGAEMADEIAVIGMAGRYPGAADLATLWDNFMAGVSAVSEIPASRWWAAAGHQPGAYLDEVDAFDPLFFGISPREAALLDPQQKLMLQVVWHTLEDAGYTPERLNADGQVGVYLASMYQHYGQLAAEQWALGRQVAAEGSLWSIANRVSHHLGFSGPSMGLDSACSGGLLSIKMACDALRLGQCQTAIAGAANLILHPGHDAALRQSNMLSPSAQVRPFAPDADGMVGGEGVGALLLKPYRAALAAGDPVYGVICADACNYKGHTEGGYAVPSAAAEQDVMQQAWSRVQRPFVQMDYLEVQATGIVRGDQAEADAIAQLLTQRQFQHQFQQQSQKRSQQWSQQQCIAPVRLGSVKTQLGHLEAASGIAQLTRVMLQFKQRCWLPNPGTQVPENLQAACYFTEQAEPWGDDNIRYAGINAFGAGGTNVHLVVRSEPGVVEKNIDEKYTADKNTADKNAGAVYVIPLSARKAAQLKQLALALHDHLSRVPDALAAVAYTLQTGRRQLRHRHLFVAQTREQLLTQLQHFAPAADQHEGVSVAQTLSDPHGLLTDQPALRLTLEQWLGGTELDWSTQIAQTEKRIVSLPGYPFEQRRGWLYEPTFKSGDTPDFLSTEHTDMNPSDHAQDSVFTHPHTGAVNPDAVPAAAVFTPDNAQTDITSAQAAIITMIAELQAIPREEIDPQASLENYGFDSISYFAFAEKLQTCFAVEISPTLFYQHSTVAALAGFFATANAKPVSQQKSTAPASVSNHKTWKDKTVREPHEKNVPAADSVIETKTADREDFAIVGMSGRFPGSRTLDEFWQNLVRATQPITAVPENRFSVTPGSAAAPFAHGGFLDDIDQFDHEFFNFSPREARLMDPQHRLMLQTVSDCIADAGYRHEDLAGTATGIFVAVAASDYAQQLSAAGEAMDGQIATGNVHSILVNRISYLLDITGPSEPINTACSSSLVAVHRAVQALRAGECTQALVGGVNLILGPDGHEAFAASGMLSPTGACHTFDTRADGYTRSEGCAAVWIKPLTQALEAGDVIHAVIKGSAVGHGGRASSLTAPNPDAQARVINQALRDAGISAADLSYVETHGTGTALGDPIEIDGLKQVFSAVRADVNADSHTDKTDKPVCPLGAVKADIGHLETAAGIAGLLKLVLSLKHKIQLPVNHLQQVNPLIDLSDSPMTLLRQLRYWPQHSQPRRAGVSSFGFGGVNAHVVVEEAPEIRKKTAPVTPPQNVQLASFSAPSESQLQTFLQTFLTWLDTQTDLDFADLCYTLQASRSHHACRLAIVATGVSALRQSLIDFLGEQQQTENRFVSRTEKPLAKDTFSASALKTLTQAATAQGDINELARLWCMGVDLALPLSGGCRVSLPPVPFAGQRHWYRQAETAVVNTPVQSSVQSPPAQSPPVESLSVSEPADSTPVKTGAESAPVQSTTDTTVVSKNVVSKNVILKTDVSKTVEPASTAQVTASVATPVATPIATPIATSIATTASKTVTTAAEEKNVQETTIQKKTTVYNQLLEIVAAALETDPENIDPDQRFPDYGVDSICGLRIMQKVQQHYGEDIAMTVIIEEPTLNKLAAFIEAQCPAEAQPEATDSNSENAVVQENSVQENSVQESNVQETRVQKNNVQETSVQETSVKESEQAVADIAPPFTVTLNCLQQRQGSHASVFLPSITGEHTWSLFWSAMAEHDNSSAYRLGWQLQADVLATTLDRNALIQALAQSLATLDARQLILYSTGYTAYLAIGVAHALKALNDIDICFRFIEPLASEEIDQTASLHYVREQCERIWPIAVDTQKPLTSLDDLRTCLAPPAGKLMGSEPFNKWFEQVSRNLQSLPGMLQRYVPKLWVSAKENQIILRKPGTGNNAGKSSEKRTEHYPEKSHTASLVNVLVPPAQFIQLTGDDIYTAAALKHYREQCEANRGNQEFPLVHVNPHGERTPSFWVHTLLGDVSFTLNLSHHLGKHWPLLGIEQFSVDGELALLPSIEKMAEHYVQSLQDYQPSGPYIIGGYSFGGVVAYEMCRQLQAQNQTVEKLILIDSFMPNTETFNSIDVSSVETDSFDVMALLLVANNFGKRYNLEAELTLEQVSGLPLAQQFERVAEFLSAGETRLSQEKLRVLVENNYNTILSNNKALLDYQPQHLDSATEIILFHATQGFIAADNIYGMPEVPVLIADRSNGFKPFIRQPITIIDVEADHYSICHDHNMIVLAEHLTRTPIHASAEKTSDHVDARHQQKEKI